MCTQLLLCQLFWYVSCDINKFHIWTCLLKCIHVAVISGECILFAELFLSIFITTYEFSYWKLAKMATTACISTIFPPTLSLFHTSPTQPPTSPNTSPILPPTRCSRSSQNWWTHSQPRRWSKPTTSWPGYLWSTRCCTTKPGQMRWAGAVRQYMCMHYVVSHLIQPLQVNTPSLPWQW